MNKEYLTRQINGWNQERMTFQQATAALVARTETLVLFATMMAEKDGKKGYYFPLSGDQIVPVQEAIQKGIDGNLLVQYLTPGEIDDADECTE